MLSFESDKASQRVIWMHSGDGKRQKTELAVPDDVSEDELDQYLFDIYLEEVIPWNGDIKRLE